MQRFSSRKELRIVEEIRSCRRRGGLHFLTLCFLDLANSLHLNSMLIIGLRKYAEAIYWNICQSAWYQPSLLPLIGGRVGPDKPGGRLTQFARGHAALKPRGKLGQRQR